MTITIIGLGLIGGSMALELKSRGFAQAAHRLVGVDNNSKHGEEALSLGIVDELMSLEEGVKAAGLIVIAVPVNHAPLILKKILPMLNKDQVVIDVGSTKGEICLEVSEHEHRPCFVATHPIAGTEKSGPSAAHLGLFHNKINIICEKTKSSPQALALVEELYSFLKMTTIYMDPVEHDKHIAYVSHLSHISSFMLGLTVLEMEASEKNIFNMAGSGFESTVRLAKSSPDMWTPIFEQNKEHISAALGSYIDQLILFKSYIDEDKSDMTHTLMSRANDIKRILDGIPLKSKILSNNNV